MKVTQKYYTINKDASYTKSVKEKNYLSEHLIKYPCYMFLDQATHTGCSIFDSNRCLISTVYIEKKKTTEVVKFRKKLRDELEKLIEIFQIDKVFYEGVFGGQNFDTVDVLLSIKHTIEDMCSDLGIKGYPIENTKWKSRLSSPNTWKQSVNDKIQIRKYVFEYYPNLISLPEDVIDSLGMGIAVMFKTGTKLRPLEMRLDKNLPINIDIVVMKNIEEIYEAIEGSKQGKKLDKLEVHVFDYDPTLDLETNFKYILTNYNVLAVSLIPEHRYKGQIMFLHNISPSELGEGFMLAIATRKNS